MDYKNYYIGRRYYNRTDCRHTGMEAEYFEEAVKAYAAG